MQTWRCPNGVAERVRSWSHHRRHRNNPPKKRHSVGGVPDARAWQGHHGAFHKKPGPRSPRRNPHQTWGRRALHDRGRDGDDLELGHVRHRRWKAVARDRDVLRHGRVEGVPAPGGGQQDRQRGETAATGVGREGMDAQGCCAERDTPTRGWQIAVYLRRPGGPQRRSPRTLGARGRGTKAPDRKSVV